MADLTGIFNATGIAKGQDNTVTLDKALLEQQAALLEQTAYFQDSANWQRVKAVYITNEGRQVNELLFDATVASPTGNFNPTDKARDTWEIQSIIIFDFDGGFLRIKRGDLNTADFDIFISGLVDFLITNNNFDAISSTTSSTSNFITVQTFSYTENYSINYMSVGLRHFGSSTGSLQMQVVDPDGNIVLESSTTTLDASTIPNIKTKYQFDFAGSTTLVKNKIYYAVITSAGDLAANNLLIYNGSLNNDNYGSGYHDNASVYPTSFNTFGQNDTSIDVRINAPAPVGSLKESEGLSNLTGSQYLSFNNSGSVGQTFTATSDYNLTDIAIDWKTASISNIQGTIKIELYDSVGGTLLGESEAQDANQTLDNTLKKMKFNSPVSITSGDSYYFKLVPVSGTNFDTTNLRVSASTSTVYAGGSAYANDVEVASQDVVFEIFGYTLQSANVFDSANTDLATFTLSNNDLTSQGTNPDTSSIQYAYLNFELGLSSNDQKVLEFIIDDKGTGSAFGNGFIVGFLNTGDNKDTVAIDPDYWPFRGYARINVNNVNNVPNQGSVYVHLDTSTGSESKTGNARGGTGISNGEIIRISIDLDANELTFSCFLSDGVTQVGSSFVVDITSPASSFDRLVVAQYMVNDTFGTTIKPS